MHVVATAGHVDHGKSTLVEALTGMAPDRLEEERRRGLSIQLGYCWTSLPGAGDVAFVDVPGHERFIATTLSGVGPVPAVMFVVAADDPWMPQAAEHLAALDALGVERGVLVVTRSDLAEPAPALARAQAELAGTSLRDVPSVTVSGRTGAGLDDLRGVLARVLASLPAQDADAAVRLWVDRRFHVRGTGTVVTGTLPAGTVSAGDLLHVHGLDGVEARVRGIECLGRPVATVTGTARVALDLGGHAPEQVTRGSVLVTPDSFERADVVDVRLRGEGRPPERPLLHAGAASVTVHARPLSADLFRLVLERPLPVRIGDRGILRDPGSRAMWGVRVLDPAPPPLGRRGSAALRAKELADADGSTVSEVDRRGLVRRSLLRRVGAAGDLPAEAVEAGGWVLSGERVADLRARLVAVVRDTGTPAQPWVPLTQAARLLGLPDDRLVAALVSPPLELSGGRLRDRRAADLPVGLVAPLEALRADLAARPFGAPDAARLAELGLGPRDLAVLARAGHLLRVAEAVVLLPGADDQATDVLRELPEPFSVSEAREALGSTRRVVLPLLAHLDRTGRTLRMADDRRCVRRRGNARMN